MKSIVISDAGNSIIEVIHHDSDPAVWIVRSWTKFMCFRKRVSSQWFSDEQQALAFANEIKFKYRGD